MYPDPEYPAVSSSHGPTEFALRQLDTGEILDRTFSLYRQRFSLFVGIAILPAAVSLVFGVARILLLHAQHLPPTTRAFSSISLSVLTAISTLCSFAAAGVTAAAATLAIADVYLGKTTTIASSFAQAAKHWLRYSWLSIVLILQALWLPMLGFMLLLGLVMLLTFGSRGAGAAAMVGVLTILALLASIPWWLYRYAKVVLAMPASAIEDLGVVDSIKRSKYLTRDRKWRIVLLFVVVGALYLVVGTVVGMITLINLRTRSQGVLLQMVPLLVAFFGNILLQPIYSIGICITYFDERVRLEGFDIEFMMQQSIGLHEPVSEPTSNDLIEG